MQWARLRVTTDRNFFGGTPAMVNAWYQPELNSITFPAGILQPPFFSYDRPMAANFGGIGIVMGHELSHGFDDQGVQFDGLGYMRNWMDPNTTIGFLNMANCVINEYSQYCFPNLTLPVKCINGRNTQGENIADNGGMQAAFHAYQNWVKANGQEASLPGFEKYSMEKVFFLNFGNIWCSKLTPNALERHLLGDPHSPAVARVTESLRNFPLFGQTFGCKPGDFMYPTQGTCTVW